MNNQIYNTGKTEIILIDLPDGVTQYALLADMVEDNRVDVIYYRETNELVDLPEGYTYTILGRALQMSETQWESLVSRVDDGLFIQGAAFENYMDDNMFFETATESGHSFLKSIGVLLENPYGEAYIPSQIELPGYRQEQSFNDHNIELLKAYDNAWKRWKEAQQQVKNPLILKLEKI